MEVAGKGGGCGEGWRVWEGWRVRKGGGYSCTDLITAKGGVIEVKDHNVRRQRTEAVQGMSLDANDEGRG